MAYLSALMSAYLLIYFTCSGVLNILMSFLEERRGDGFMLFGLTEVAVATWIYFASGLF